VTRPRPTRLILLLALAACAPAADPAAGTNVLAASNTPVSPPPPPAPAPAQVTAALAWAGGVTTPLATPGATLVGPGASFRVELPGAFADARLTLLDESEALVTGQGQRLIGPGTALTFQPDAPLAAGGRYRLRLDGVSTRELHAADGTVALPVDWRLTVAGESPIDRPRPAGKKHPR
jgi:hypothetical protein